MQPFNEIWTLALDELRQQYSQSQVDLWFSKLILCDLTENLAVLLCDEDFKYNILVSKYTQHIRDALTKALGFDVDVMIIDRKHTPAEYSAYGVDRKSPAPEPINLADMPQTGAPANGPVVTEAEPSYFAAGATSPRQTVSRTAKVGANTASGAAAPAVIASTAKTADGELTKAQPPQLYQSEYTFENFIVGSSNKFAHAASIAIANDPVCASNKDSMNYNPLFIYGPSGLGKTHLLYAIINHIRKTRPELKIVYVRGEEFTNQLIDSIAKKTSEQFREKYRTNDILLIDDVQFIAGRDATQEEFFHTFNALHEDHKQIILTSDRPPRDIKTLEDRLKTRFEWGITADIQPPDPDLRAAILKKKAETMNIQLPSDVLNFLAENLKSNIRQFEGALKKLGAMSLLTGMPITIDFAKSSIADLMTGNEPVGVTIDRIFERVAKKYGVDVSDIKGTKRTKDIAYARHITIYIIRKLTDMSLPQIGKLFKRDHTTILSSLKTIEKELGTSSVIDIEISELLKEIKG